jgi:rhamnose ABC transporter rhamnose-binding protein
MKLGFLLIVSLAVLSCQKQSSSSGAAPSGTTGGKQITVALMPKLVGIDYFNACEKGAKEAAKELGVELVYDGPTIGDVTKQAEMLDTWIVRKFDVIGVASNDPHALAPTLKKAMEKGIKVITWDADSDADSRQYFVNQATFEGIGSGLVDAMAEQIGGKGEVAIISGSTTAANQKTWMEFMRKRITEKYPEMKIVTVQYPEEDQLMAVTKTQDVIKAYPNLKGIFGITSVAFPGAAEAVQQAGKTGQIAVTGLSTPKSMKQYVENGVVRVFLLWNAVDLGYLSVHVAKKLTESDTLPEKFTAGRLGEIEVKGQEVLLGPPIRFTKENIGEFDF